jgi:hypothetical protein
MIFYRIIIGLLKRDPRFKPLDKTGIQFYDRLMEIIPTLNRKYPSKFSKLLIRRHYLLKYRSPLRSQLLYLKTLRWKLRLYISKQIQETLYISPTKRLKLYYFFYFLMSLVVGAIVSDLSVLPGHQFWSINYLLYPKTHWMISYILEDTSAKSDSDFLKKDNLAMGVDRLVLQGIENKELDTLNWILLGTKFASMQEMEFSYLAFQLAHYKDHQNIGGNSMQPLEGFEASRFFANKE